MPFGPEKIIKGLCFLKEGTKPSLIIGTEIDKESKRIKVLKSHYSSHIHFLGESKRDDRLNYFITTWEYNQQEKKFSNEPKIKQSLYVWGDQLK